MSIFIGKIAQYQGVYINIKVETDGLKSVFMQKTDCCQSVLATMFIIYKYING